MFEPIPEPSMSSDYLKIRENEKHRIRIMGTSKDPATFIQGWEAWGDDNKPHRKPYELGQPCPKELRDLDRDNKPRLFWFFTVWHVDEDKPMVFEVTQSTIKTAILAYAKNPAWGDPSHYVLEIGRTGSGLETEYTVIAEPPVQPPAKAVLDAMKDAMIDLRVILNGEHDGNPFGALGLMPATNDQENIRQLRKQGKPIPMGQEQEALSSVGNVAQAALSNLKAAKDKQAVKDDIPY